MTIDKPSPTFHHLQTLRPSYSAAKPANDNGKHKTLEQLSTDLARKLNILGRKLRVKRRRGDTNVRYAEKLASELERRLNRAFEHVAHLQDLGMDCDNYLALTRSDQVSLRKRHGRRQ
jgi:hypothetical protein